MQNKDKFDYAPGLLHYLVWGNIHGRRTHL